MQTPFILEWPQDCEEIVFASHTSLITKDMLAEEIKKIGTGKVESIVENPAEFIEALKLERTTDETSNAHRRVVL